MFLKCFVVLLGLLGSLAACSNLPQMADWDKHAEGAAAKFANARGALSEKRSAAIIAQLKAKSGDLDILDKQIALEQTIVGSPLVVGNRVVLLEDGPKTYEAMFAAIRRAQDHIHVESYIIESDDVGQQFAELLMERQRLGVQVHLMYDSFGSWSTDKAYFKQLTQAGVKVVEFNPVNPLLARIGWNPNHRDHRKLLIVDGHTVFLGGINISSVYSSGSSIKGSRAPKNQETGWRDTHVQIEGPVVAEFQKLFMQTWAKQKGPELSNRQYFPVVEAKGSDIVRAIGSTPDDPFSLTYLTLIAAIDNAEKQVYITNAYFVPDPQLMDSLLAAVKRGVDVRMILPGITDSATVYHAGRSHYSRLLQGGIQIFERRNALLHSKTVLVDGVWSSVGSSNLDWRSALDNDEVNAIILGREMGAKMQAAFARDAAESDAIELERWQQRPLLLRIKEWSARLVARLL